jgi:hypothetical protein
VFFIRIVLLVWFEGEFLTAGAPCQESGKKTKRVVCLMRENDSNDQVWRIDRHPGKKGMAMARKRSHETAQL